MVIVLDCGNYERICANLENYYGTAAKYWNSTMLLMKTMEQVIMLKHHLLRQQKLFIYF